MAEGARKCGSIRKGRGRAKKIRKDNTTRQEGESQVLSIFDFDFEIEIGSTCYGACWLAPRERRDKDGDGKMGNMEMENLK